MLIKTFGWAVREAITASYQYIKALIDDTIKGVFRSIGDAGATPSNTTGKTALQLGHDLFRSIGDAGVTPINTTGKTFLQLIYDLNIQKKPQQETIPSGEIWYIAPGVGYGVKTQLIVEGKIEIDGKLAIL